MIMNNNSLANRGTQELTVSSFLGKNNVQEKLKALGFSDKDRKSFVTSIISATTNNSALAQCSHASILATALEIVSLGLSPSPQAKEAYMVPFKGQVKLVVGYRAYINKMVKSGLFKRIHDSVVKEGELVNCDPIKGTFDFKCLPMSVRADAPTVGYYCIAETHTGLLVEGYMSKEEVIAHADRYAQTFKASEYQKLVDGKITGWEKTKLESKPWYGDFDAMGLKTVWLNKMTKFTAGLTSDSMAQESINKILEIEDKNREDAQTEKLLGESDEDSFAGDFGEELEQKPLEQVGDIPEDLPKEKATKTKTKSEEPKPKTKKNTEEEMANGFNDATGGEWELTNEDLDMED